MITASGRRKKTPEHCETCERADGTGKTPTSLVGKGQGWRLLETQQGGRKESPQADICAPGKRTVSMVQEDRRRCWQHSSSDTTCWEPGSDVQLEISREVSLLQTLVRKNVQGLNEAWLWGWGDASTLMACFGGSVWYVMLTAFLVTEKCNGEERWRDGDASREPALVYVYLWDGGQGPWTGFTWLYRLSAQFCIGTSPLHLPVQLVQKNMCI